MRRHKQTRTTSRGSQWTLTDDDEWHILGTVEYHERNSWDGKHYYHAIAMTGPRGSRQHPWAFVPGAKAARKWVEAELAGHHARI